MITSVSKTESLNLSRRKPNFIPLSIRCRAKPEEETTSTHAVRAQWFGS